MKRQLHLVRAFAISVAGISLAAAAATPSVLSQVAGGQWEISRSGQPPVLLCIADPAILAQFENRGGKCARNIVRDGGSSTTIHYSCAGGGFGQSDIRVLTPRSLRVETQGISDNAPFKYTFQARRVGDCPSH